MTAPTRSFSIFDLFKIGIGPSSSHTVGPMIAARQFACQLDARGLLPAVQRLEVELFGSLAATGVGHGTDRAVLLGLAGHLPEQVDPDQIDAAINAIHTSGQLAVLGRHLLPFVPRTHLLMRRKSLPYHPNGMQFHAFGADGAVLLRRVYYSVGGGFVVDEQGARVLNMADPPPPDALGTGAGLPYPYRTGAELPYPYRTGAELLAHCQATGLSVAALTLANEQHWHSAPEVRRRLLHIWHTMAAAVHRGCAGGGQLPGPLHLQRRAPALHQRLCARPEEALRDPLSMLDWVNLYAMAVNEENAAGGRVVTAPTNGAAGVVPAVLHYYARFVPGANDEGIVQFLLTAGAIGLVYKQTASLSGAEVGCQGEVGVACSMAAGALAAVLGGTPAQVENAAEIGMEHNLGMTCDPVGGLVQIPCIERNAVAAMRAINAVTLANFLTFTRKISLDLVIKTMYDTGRDLNRIYRETADGGLAKLYARPKDAVEKESE